MSGVGLGGRESDLTIPECGLAIMGLWARDGAGGARWGGRWVGQDGLRRHRVGQGGTAGRRRGGGGKVRR